MVSLDKSVKIKKKKETQEALNEQQANPNTGGSKTSMTGQDTMHVSKQDREYSVGFKQNNQQKKEGGQNLTNIDSPSKKIAGNDQQIDINDVFDPEEHAEFEKIVKDWDLSGNQK